MFNHKTNNADSKNCTADLKNNTSDSRNNNGDSKNNNADFKNNNADLKNNNADSKMNRLESRNYNADFKSNPDSKPNADAPAQGDSGDDNMPPSPVGQGSHNGNKVYKSGPLFLSSKGIGWTSWKKRWFILTETSLVFFRSDPNAVPQKGSEANLTLGGIDLNSSGSVVVKADKKLLTVLFPDGRDGRAFTLKAETSEDLFEWKNALEEALANAPSVATGPGQNGALKNEKGDNAADGSQEQSSEQASPKSIVLGRPILLALEDIDGTPSFLEKALRYVEDHGVRVEGILRQAADVDDVEHRIREYEQGKTEFTANEDGHVMGDCIKYVLRELPSPPVPASCCAALLEAYRSDRATRVSAMRAAVLDTFPEPNRRLLQRILIMMEAVAEHKSVNRMSVSAVAACMSPLLLRPLLAGEVDLGKGPEMGGDGSAQLLQAAAAANHAQAIVIILLEEYDKIFGEEDMVSDLYSDSEDYGSESEDLSDEYYEEDEDYEDEEDEDGEYTSECSRSYEDSAHGSSVTCSEDEKGSGSVSPDSISHEVINDSHSKMQAKKASMDSLEYVTEQQGEILRLEALKAKLKEKIEAESRQNVILKDDLVNKKHALEVQRVALQQEVSRLQQELQMEKGSQGAVPSSVSTNEKTMAEPEGIAHAEADDPVLQPPSPNQGKVKDKEKDREFTKTTSRRSKDTHSSKEYSDKNQFPSFSNKIPPGRSERASSSRRSNARGEAANTTSALSKLTNRLNFLKERRNQIADELQHIDKDHKSHKHHRSSRKWSESPQMSDDSNTSETHHQGQKESSFQQTEATRDKGRSEDQSTNHSNIDDKTYSR